MIKLEINDLEFFVKPTISVLEACKLVGILIPRFCYHEILSVAGNCRICLVEISNSPKPVASCALPVLNNMKIFVETPLVKKARTNVLETLLLNHPLDCPICDQGGECDLQDQTKNFGNFMQRFFFPKRIVEDKYCGPLIKTIMTRCIHCTRCVRFSTEIAGNSYYGTLNRGKSTEISSYSIRSFESELSGNVIDLCPVGALTSKPYTFKARPWELRTIESIDTNDSFGSNLYVNSKESEILRITPKINFELNNNLISNKARFSYDAQINQRQQYVLKQDTLKSTFEREKWANVLTLLKQALTSKKKATFFINNDIDFNTLKSLTLLSYKYGISLRNVDNYTYASNTFISYLSNKIQDIKKESSVCFILSSNLQIESTLLNARLRLKQINENFTVIGCAQSYKANFPIQFVNINIKKFLTLFEGKNLFLSRILIAFKNPIICFGETLSRYGVNFNQLTSLVKTIIPTTIVLNIVKASNSEGVSFLMNKVSSKNDYINADYLFFINMDNTYSLTKQLINNSAKLIWFNTHTSALSLKAQLVLPILSEFEEEKILVNMEQRPQKGLKACFQMGESRSLQALLNILIKTSREPKKVLFDSFQFEILNNPTYFSNLRLSFTNTTLIAINFLTTKQLISIAPIKPLFNDFYQSTKNSKYSLIMAKCSQQSRKLFTNF